MSNLIFDLYISHKSAKAIWEKLEKKYEADDAGKKKYAVGNWLKFMMSDNLTIMDQVHTYENLTAEVLAEGMKMCEILQANVLIEKLPESWSTYRNHLKHKKKYMTLKELIGHMKIEEANRLKDKNSLPISDSVEANLVESVNGSHDRSKQRSRWQNKRSSSFKRTGNIQKGKGACYFPVQSEEGHQQCSSTH
ncbi:hypothetical protein LINPERHAP2_LOCUS16697 [Linum perenne]